MKQGRIPSNQIRGYRRVFASPVLADNASFQIDLPRGPAIESAFVIVSGVNTVTTGGTAVRDGAAAKFINRIDWVLNGNITLDSITGYGAWLCDKYFGHGATSILNPTAASAASYPFVAAIPLHRIAHDFTRPKDSVLKTDENVTTNQLRLQFGTLASMLTGAAVSNYTGNVAFSVFVSDYQEAPDANGRTPIPLYYWKRTEQLLALASTGTGLPFRVNTGNRLRGLILMPQDNVNSEPTQAVCTRVRVVRSGDTRIDLTQDCFEVLSNYANPSVGIGQTNPQLQYAIVVDFANPLGLAKVSRYSECWPVPSNADVQLQLDIGAVGSIRMITVEGVDLYPS